MSEMYEALLSRVEQVAVVRYLCARITSASVPICNSLTPGEARGGKLERLFSENTTLIYGDVQSNNITTLIITLN